MLFRLRYLRDQRFVRLESGGWFIVLILSLFWLPPLSVSYRLWQLWLWRNWQSPRVMPGIVRMGPLVVCWWSWETHGKKNQVWTRGRTRRDRLPRVAQHAAAS